MDEIHITTEMFRSIGDDHPLCKWIDAIQDNIIAYNQMFADLPELTVYATDDIYLSLNVLPVPENYVYRTRLTAENVDKRLDEIIQKISDHTTHIDWTVYRQCTPANLGEKLIERGFTIGRIPWMLMEFSDLPDVTYPDDFRIEFVADEEMMAVWRDISARGFHMDSAQIFYDAYIQQGFDPEGDIVHYVGYSGGQPVTSASLLCAGGIPGLYNISTLPDFRGKGYGTAITHWCLKVAQARGYPYACVMPSDMGRKIYRKLGFVVSIDVPEYQWALD